MPMAAGTNSAGGGSTTGALVNSNSNSVTTPGGGGGGLNNNVNSQNSQNNTPSGAAAAAAAAVTGKTWELSDYELHRTPQDAIQDGSEIAVSPRALHSELMCPICLDMLENTMTTKECLHRFCAQCIITALRSGNKECPTCRKKLVSKRSLRPDPNFDALISKIYPSRDEYEAQQQKAMARLSKSHNQLALATSIEEGMKAQSQLRKPTPKTAGAGGVKASQPETPSSASAPASGVPDPSTTTSGGALGPLNGNGTVGLHGEDSVALATSAAAGPSAAKISRTDSSITGGVGGSDHSSEVSEEVTEVELVFKAHPEMLAQNPPNSPQVQTRFLKTTANALVEHLAKYISMRLALDSCDSPNPPSPNQTCTIYVSPNGGNSFVNIPQNQSLSTICEKFWRFNKPLEMFYSWKK